MENSKAFVTYRSLSDKSIIEILHLMKVKVDDLTSNSFVYVDRNGEIVMINKENKYEEPKDMVHDIGYVSKQGAGGIKKVKEKLAQMYGGKDGNS